MHVAMLLHKSLEHDSRVQREARALAEAGHRVTVLHLPALPGERERLLDGFAAWAVTPPSWVRRVSAFGLYRGVWMCGFVVAVRRLRPDIVHAHDLATLGPGSVGARLTTSRVVYDSHEYAAGVPYRGYILTWLVTLIERVLIRRCAAVITVSDGIAERLEQRYRLARRPTVVRNVVDPSAAEPDFDPPDLRKTLALDDGMALILHLGAVTPDRGCETLVEALARLPVAHLLFLGADDARFEASLRRRAVEIEAGRRVSFLPPVPVGQVAGYARQADLGVSMLEDSCENHRLALPNKVFEYIHAGLPVVAADLPELHALVERHRIGRLVRPDDPSDVARGLAAALADRHQLTRGVERARRELTWGTESGRLTELYARLALAPIGVDHGADR